MKHAIRKSSKAIRKAQSVFLRGVVFPAIEEARQAFASVERVPYMPELEECTGDHYDADYAQMWEGR